MRYLGMIPLKTELDFRAEFRHISSRPESKFQGNRLTNDVLCGISKHRCFSSS
jgi:hypothetical protein